MKLIGIIVALTLIGGLLTYFSNSYEIPSVSPDEPLSTLACNETAGQDALTKVLRAYESGGDKAAYEIAESYINAGVCEYSTAGLSWARPGSTLPGVEPYMEVPCTTLANGYCIAIQPVYGVDARGESIAWSGYMLVRPRDESGQARPSTVVSRTQKGLILDLNY
jgi:hypothetical protein